MKHRDLHNLLNRAAAAIETPGDITARDRDDLIEDLATAARRPGRGTRPAPRSAWEDDGIQFPRFIAEADAAGAFTPRVVAAMADSMDLGAMKVLDLLARATLAWERIKDGIANRRKAPARR